MKTSALLALCALVSLATAEFCASNSDCFMENCPGNYVIKCLDNVCTCEVRGECSTSSDCQNTHGRCDNNDKHWYCNDNRCCCGEPCHHSGEHFICTSASQCSEQFYRCDNDDKHWYCVDSHCHCGSRDGDLPGN